MSPTSETTLMLVNHVRQKSLGLRCKQAPGMLTADSHHVRYMHLFRAMSHGRFCRTSARLYRATKSPTLRLSSCTMRVCRVIAKFHYTDPTKPDRTGPDQKKSAHIVGDELNSTRRARHGPDRTRPDPHGLFLRRNSVGSVRVSDKVRAGPFGSERVRSGPVGPVSGPCRTRVVEFSYKQTRLLCHFFSLHDPPSQTQFQKDEIVPYLIFSALFD